MSVPLTSPSPTSAPTRPLPIVRTVADLRAAVATFRPARVALVPTMGALHAGHLALIAAARAAGAERVVASVFVNPAQFGPDEDFARYPRDEVADAAKLAAAGCDLLFAPAVSDVYPPGFATRIEVAGLTERFEGAVRPGHFAGVATVVTKLLIACAPDLAVFGEKDWQQLAVIRRLVVDLALPVEIVGAPIVRDADGLALSSRNAYLSADERARAVTLPRALAAAREALQAGVPVTTVLTTVRTRLVTAGFAEPDYVALVNAEMQPLETLAGTARLIAAARIGGTRLLDNLTV
ncbi:MAG: pantoate--beta-alanine ligase [Sphingomonadaceae bacterium]|nr:pantoate--beta-alanine ligase [Sphingomonadaceae bacterium]